MLEVLSFWVHYNIGAYELGLILSCLLLSHDHQIEQNTLKDMVRNYLKECPFVEANVLYLCIECAYNWQW